MARRPVVANDGGDDLPELGVEGDGRDLGVIIRDVVDLAYGFDGKGHDKEINHLTGHLRCASALSRPPRSARKSARIS